MMRHLTLVQKYKIETYKNLSKGITEIANYHCMDKSVFLREINRDADGRSDFFKIDLILRKTVNPQQKVDKKN